MNIPDDLCDDNVIEDDNFILLVQVMGVNKKETQHGNSMRVVVVRCFLLIIRMPALSTPLVLFAAADDDDPDVSIDMISPTAAVGCAAAARGRNPNCKTTTVVVNDTIIAGIVRGRQQQQQQQRRRRRR
jgi:hypothetical protein